jgi:23S rRNA (guanosine2251-2'-O)-methyltransferase
VKNNLIYGVHAVTKAIESDKVTSLYVQQGKKNKAIKTLLALAERKGISVNWLDDKAFEQQAGSGNHQGIMAMVASLSASYSEDDIPFIFERNENNLILVLDEVTDPHNVGACLRSANAFGVSMVIAPRKHSAPLNATVCKVACGAAETTPYIQVTNLVRTLSLLKELGAWTYGADMGADTSLSETKFAGHVVIVMGSEGQGLRRLTKDTLDEMFSIPMMGEVESLNVSVASAIALYEVRGQFKKRA